ncbi:Protein FREE1, partial [Dichanthelium oligosanthes]
VDLPHYAPPAAAPPPPQPYYPYEQPPLPPSPHNPLPSPYPSLDRAGSYGYGSGSGVGSSYGQELYPPKPAGEGGWSDDGVYAYNGGDAPEPYGARGTAPRSGSGSGSALFDDYGRSIGSATDRGGRGSSAASPKVVRAVPKAETTEDVRGGVQKFRVKLLPEGAGSPMDVLCQVGLDGIRMLDPNTSRTLRIYPLETVTRWDVLDSSIFAFWSKSSVDVEAKRIRLKSNSYTSNTILDTVTAATVQFKEMGGSSISRSRAIADAAKPAEQQNERKKIFPDWRNLMKPMNEEKDHWVPDEAVSKCTQCAADFSAFNRRAEVTQRLANAREVANRPIVHSHEDLAKKLQEAMDINKRSSSGEWIHLCNPYQIRPPLCRLQCIMVLPLDRDKVFGCFWQANAGGRMPYLHSPSSGLSSKFQLLAQRRLSAAYVSILSSSVPVEVSRQARVSSRIHERKALFNRACCSIWHGALCSVLYMNELNPLQI